jgi:hypothetical protein
MGKVAVEPITRLTTACELGVRELLDAYFLLDPPNLLCLPNKDNAMRAGTQNSRPATVVSCTVVLLITIS